MAQRKHSKGARFWLGRFSFSAPVEQTDPASDFAKRWEETFSKPDPNLKLSHERRPDYRGQRLRRVIRTNGDER